MIKIRQLIRLLSVAPFPTTQQRHEVFDGTHTASMPSSMVMEHDDTNVVNSERRSMRPCSSTAFGVNSAWVNMPSTTPSARRSRTLHNEVSMSRTMTSKCTATASKVVRAAVCWCTTSASDVPCSASPRPFFQDGPGGPISLKGSRNSVMIPKSGKSNLIGEPSDTRAHQRPLKCIEPDWCGGQVRKNVLLNFSYTSLPSCHACRDNKNQCTQTDMTSVSVQSTPFSRPSRHGVLLLCKLGVQVWHIKQALLTIIFVAWSSTRNSLHRPSNAPRGQWSLWPRPKGRDNVLLSWFMGHQ